MNDSNSLWDNHDIVNALQDDQLVVMPTDTVYGIVGRAQSPVVIDKIYKYRKNIRGWPCIILISDFSGLAKFSVVPAESHMEYLSTHWPGPVTFIFDSPGEEYSDLHRGFYSLAFRVPAGESLRNLLKRSGPLLAPSANPEGMPFSETIEQAQDYFGDIVGLYVDGGTITGKPSKIIRLHSDGLVTVIRE